MESKHAAMAIVSLVFLASLVAGVQFVEVTEANFWHPSQIMPYISIYSPKDQIYNQSTISFKTITFCDEVEITYPNWHYEELKWLNFSLDGTSQALEWTFPLSDPGYPDRHIPYRSYTDTNLTDLCDGQHFLSVYGETTFGSRVSANVTFSVDSTPPIITIISPQNTIYPPTSIALNFTINEPTSWMGYSLNNQANITLTENITLPRLQGKNSLVVYANDTTGKMGKSELINFEFGPEPYYPTPPITQQPTPSSTPIQPDYYGGAVDYTPTLVMISIMALTAALGVVAYFYFKKRGR